MASNSFDFSTVSVETAEMPKNGAGRPRTRKDNPFTEILATSFEAFKNDEEAGRSITVPGKAVGEAVYLIRQAADDLGIGARVVTRKGNGEALAVKDCKTYSGKVTVLFAGKARKAAPKPAEGDAGTEPQDEGDDA